MHTAGLPFSGGSYASLGSSAGLRQSKLAAEICEDVSGEAVMHKVGTPIFGRTLA